MKEKKENSGKKNKYIFYAVTALFAVGFLLCAAWLVRYFVNNARAESKLEDLKEQYVTQPSALPQETQEPGETDAQESMPQDEGDGYPGLEGYDVPEKEIDFGALQEENPDIYAWITVPGTVIDYPVLQHGEQVDYYLNHNLDGSRGYPGCIYTEMYNSKDWEDPNTVIYGHNMKDGTMFASLHNYGDSLFFEENPYIYIYSQDTVRVYEIFGAYEFSDAHLMLNFDFEDPEAFSQYLEGILTLDGLHDNFNRELSVTAEDKIITLATCIGSKPDKRYLVQAVLTAKGSVGSWDSAESGDSADSAR